jgi:hypothetical protein
VVVPTLADLVATYGADQVMAANGGAIPGSEAEGRGRPRSWRGEWQSPSDRHLQCAKVTVRIRCIAWSSKSDSRAAPGYRHPQRSRGFLQEDVAKARSRPPGFLAWCDNDQLLICMLQTTPPSWWCLRQTDGGA